MRKFLLLISVLAIATVNGGGCNMFSEFSDKTSDKVVADDVRNHINGGRWTDAIRKWNQLSPAGQLKREYIALLASAYAGRGGLDILNLINTLNTNSSSGTSTLFQILLSTFKAARDVDAQDEITAQNLINSISATQTSRTVDENMLMVFVQLAKIGTILATVADTDHDGTVDAAFDNCTMVSTAYSQQIAVSLNIIVLSLAAAGSTIGSASLAAYNAGCANIILNAVGFCSMTDPAQITGVLEQASRTLIGETNLGIGLKVASMANTFQFVAPCTGCPGITSPPMCP